MSGHGARGVPVICARGRMFPYRIRAAEPHGEAGSQGNVSHARCCRPGQAPHARGPRAASIGRASFALHSTRHHPSGAGGGADASPGSPLPCSLARFPSRVAACCLLSPGRSSSSVSLRTPLRRRQHLARTPWPCSSPTPCAPPLLLHSLPHLLRAPHTLALPHTLRSPLPSPRPAPPCPAPSRTHAPLPPPLLLHLHLRPASTPTMHLAMSTTLLGTTSGSRPRRPLFYSLAVLLAARAATPSQYLARARPLPSVRAPPSRRDWATRGLVSWSAPLTTQAAHLKVSIRKCSPPVGPHRCFCVWQGPAELTVCALLTRRKPVI